MTATHEFVSRPVTEHSHFYSAQRADWWCATCDAPTDWCEMEELRCKLVDWSERTHKAARMWIAHPEQTAREYVGVSYWTDRTRDALDRIDNSERGDLRTSNMFATLEHRAHNLAALLIHA